MKAHSFTADDLASHIKSNHLDDNTSLQEILNIDPKRDLQKLTDDALTKDTNRGHSLYVEDADGIFSALYGTVNNYEKGTSLLAPYLLTIGFDHSRLSLFQIV